MRNIQIDAGHAVKHRKNSCSRKRENAEDAEHADDQREKERQKRNARKGGFVRDDFACLGMKGLVGGDELGGAPGLLLDPLTDLLQEIR